MAPRGQANLDLSSSADLQTCLSFPSHNMGIILSTSRGGCGDSVSIINIFVGVKCVEIDHKYICEYIFAYAYTYLHMRACTYICKCIFLLMGTEYK